MFFNYESGVLVALTISAIKVLMSTSILLSQKSKNLAQIDLYYSCIKGRYVQNDGSARTVKYVIYLAYMLLITPIFSWLSAVSSIGLFLWVLAKQEPVSENIKQLQGKLGLTPLDSSQVIEIMTEINSLYGITMDKSPDDLIDLELYSNEYGTSTVIMNKTKKLLHYCGHPHDYLTVQTTEDEYRVDGTVVECRTLEKSSMQEGRNFYRIRDNVIQESDIHKNHDDEFTFLTKPKEIIDSLKKEVEWHEIESHKVKYFVLSNDSKLSIFEFCKFLQQEKQRVEESYKHLSEEINKQNGFVIDTDGYAKVQPKEGYTRQDTELLWRLFDENKWQERRITENEFFYKNQVISEIDRWLSKASRSK